jgi:hypothetical protein
MSPGIDSEESIPPAYVVWDQYDKLSCHNGLPGRELIPGLLKMLMTLVQNLSFSSTLRPCAVCCDLLVLVVYHVLKTTRFTVILPKPSGFSNFDQNVDKPPPGRNFGL